MVWSKTLYACLGLSPTIRILFIFFLQSWEQSCSSHRSRRFLSFSERRSVSDRCSYQVITPLCATTVCVPGLRVCPLSPIFWLVNWKLLIIEIKSQSQKRYNLYEMVGRIRYPTVSYLPFLTNYIFFEIRYPTYHFLQIISFLRYGILPTISYKLYLFWDLLLISMINNF